MRIFRPAYRLALPLILTVLLGACGGGGGTAASPGAVDDFSPEPAVPTVVDPVTHDLAQIVVSLPVDGQVKVGEVLRIAGAGGWKVTQEGRQEIKIESLIGQKWKQTDIRGGDFVGVSSSADGRVMAAVGSNGLYVSTDSGASWAPYQVDNQTRDLYSVSVSADGSKVMVGEDGGFIYVGTLDNGNWTWAKTSPKTIEGTWVSVALSRDGSTAAAVDLGGDVYIGTSTDNWTNSKWTGGQLKQDWWGVAISADGGKAVAVGGRGAFYVWSQDGRWTIPTPQTTVVDADWNHVACSQDCSTIVVAEDGGLIQTSTNGGAWQQRSAADNHRWYYVASSTDGIRLAAVANGGEIQFSVNGGEGWTTAAPGTNPWWSVACSADCTTMVAVADNGQIWTSIAGTTPGAQGFISGGPSDVIELKYLGNDVWSVVNQTGSPTIQ